MQCASSQKQFTMRASELSLKRKDDFQCFASRHHQLILQSACASAHPRSSIKMDFPVFRLAYRSVE